MLESSHAFENIQSAVPSHHGAAAFPQTPSGLDWFKHIFESTLADTPQQRQACFRTRFQVYCVDNRFECADQNPGGFEVDAFDGQSIHSLLTHRTSGNAIGTVRLVLPHAGIERRSLPIELLLRGTAAGDVVASLPIGRIAEVSRFAITKSFHQYTPNRGLEAALPPEEWRKLLAHLPLGLVRSCIEMSTREGITHLAAVMEPALLRLLTRFGIHMNHLGGPVEYHGLRQPCWIELEGMLKGLLQGRPEVWKLITDNGRLCPDPAHHISH